MHTASAARGHAAQGHRPGVLSIDPTLQRTLRPPGEAVATNPNGINHTFLKAWSILASTETPIDLALLRAKPSWSCASPR
jgi:hypothetical protein